MPRNIGDPVERSNTFGMSHPVRNEVVAALAEFCGTFMFLFMAFAATQAILNVEEGTPPTAARVLFVAASFGASLAANVWAFYRITGGMFNPAVSLALCLVGAITPTRFVVVFISQIVAGICAAALTDGLIPGPLLVANTLGPGVSIVQGLFLEVFLTAQLIFVVYLLAVEKHRATYLAPLGIGLAVFMCHMVGVPLTGTSVNPARSFGPAVIAGFVGYHWIYWLGPFLGAFLAWGLFKLLTVLNYGTVNAGQDEDGLLKEDTKAWGDANGSGNLKGGPPRHNGDNTYQNGDNTYQNGDNSYQQGSKSYQNGDSSHLQNRSMV